MNEILSSLHQRKSVRVYTGEPVSPAAKRAILEAACAAPTAGNQQLYTILDITDQALKDRLAETCDHAPTVKSGTTPLPPEGAPPENPARETCCWPSATPTSPPKTPSPLRRVWGWAPATSGTFWSSARHTGRF